MAGGFNKEDFSAPLAEINTTPLVDVMLVLLVVFIVTAPMLQQSVEIDLPNQEASEIDDKEPIVISIKKDGTYFWDKEEISFEQVNKKLQDQALVKDNNTAIHIRADKNVAYENVLKVLSSSQQLGLSNIGFITSPSQ